jgi:hypothetical protein
MTAKKRPAIQEPLLNTVARRLGTAAGTFTKATKELADNISALPQNVTTRVREVTHLGTSAKPARGGARPAKKKSKRGTRKPVAKVPASPRKRKLNGKGTQSSRKPSKSKV